VSGGLELGGIVQVVMSDDSDGIMILKIVRGFFKTPCISGLYEQSLVGSF
jgi:hypothetical protein